MEHATHCNTLQRTATHCNTIQQLQHTARHCNTLQHTVTHGNTRQHTAANCNTLQHTETHCNTLQHTATHCNTLQHTATHCNTLQHTAATHCWTHVTHTEEILNLFTSLHFNLIYFRVRLGLATFKVPQSDSKDKVPVPCPHGMFFFVSGARGSGGR